MMAVDFPSTVGGALGLWKPWGNYEKFPLDGEEEVLSLARHLISDFERYAIPFYEAHASAKQLVDAVDHIVRTTPPGRPRPLPHGVGHFSFLAAHLLVRGVEGAMQFVSDWPKLFTKCPPYRRIDEAEIRARLEAALAAHVREASCKSNGQ
jgi:hypothetical protein